MRRQLFTITALALWSLAGVAHADRVVLLAPRGDMDEMRMDDVEAAMVDAVSRIGHRIVTDPGGNEAVPPNDANEMRAIAELRDAQYLVVPVVNAIDDQRYRLTLRVGYAPDTRVEEIEVEVDEASQDVRLRDVFGAMLRPEGLGEDAVRLTTGEPATDSGADDEEARRLAEEEEARRQAEEEARREFEERERSRAHEELRERQEAWENRERYGDENLWMASAGFDLRPILTHSEDRSGGVMLGASFRFGRSFEQLRGFEARATVDLVGGATSGFAMTAGAVYLHSFFTAPVFIGGGGDLGFFMGFSGNRVASFLVRGSAIVAWRVVGDFWLEGHLPEIQVLTANGGVVSLGTSVHAGFRF